MVGVVGNLYQGCEGCRLRRVKVCPQILTITYAFHDWSTCSKCDNQRPVCNKCINTNRECGYVRETVFIVATSNDHGRCRSHPHRSHLPKKKKKKKKTVSGTTPPTSGSRSSPTEARREISRRTEESSPQSVSSSQYRLQFLGIHEQCLIQERRHGIEDEDPFGTASLVRNLSVFTFHSPEVDCSLLSLAFYP